MVVLDQMDHAVQGGAFGQIPGRVRLILFFVVPLSAFFWAADNLAELAKQFGKMT